MRLDGNLPAVDHLAVHVGQYARGRTKRVDVISHLPGRPVIDGGLDIGDRVDGFHGCKSLEGDALLYCINTQYIAMKKPPEGGFEATQ